MKIGNDDTNWRGKQWKAYADELMKKPINISHATSDALYQKRLNTLYDNIEVLKRIMNQTVDDNKSLRKRVDVLMIQSDEVVDRLYYTEKRIKQFHNYFNIEDESNSSSSSRDNCPQK